VIAVEDAFERLRGRQPSDQERQGLMRARDALGLKDNDALWLLLMVLGHYETLYGRFPALIAKAAADVTEGAKAAAEAELKAAAARTRAELAKSVAQTALEIADRVASTKRSKWMLTGIVLAASIFVGVGASMYGAGVSSGNAAGQLDGYSKARDEKAAAAWANTPEGQIAIGLAKAGSLRELAACSGRGWKRKGSSCLPKCEKGSVDGWNIPANGER
jgi:hypothetical protein